MENFTGSYTSLTAGSVDQAGFERICRRWYKTFIRKQA